MNLHKTLLLKKINSAEHGLRHPILNAILIQASPWPSPCHDKLLEAMQEEVIELVQAGMIKGMNERTSKMMVAV
jgi:hypothetical protein